MGRILGMALAIAIAGTAAEHKTENVILVMSDGLRWQEIFQGADAAFMDKDHGHVDDAAALKRDYWRETPEQRREALFPFLWTTIAKQGQIYGNRQAGSEAWVTNGFNFSYPGYNETLCGFPDDERIHSNDNIPNPNVTVLEWLKNRPAFADDGCALHAQQRPILPSFLEAAEIERNVSCVLIAVLGILGQHLLQNFPKLGRLRQWRNRIVEDCVQGFHLRMAPEGCPSRKHFIKHHAK